MSTGAGIGLLGVLGGAPLAVILGYCASAPHRYGRNRLAIYDWEKDG